MTTVRLLTTVADLRHFRGLVRSRQAGSSDSAAIGARVFNEVGFVATMGSLHQGHLSLIERARYENAVVVVSIFVNPLQFGPGEDFQQYPRPLAADQILCEQAGVDAIFTPLLEQLFLQDSTTQVLPPPAMTQGLCGKFRPGHFQGVATIVTKLLNLVQPKRAYFGQKDAQQLAIVQRVVSDLNFPVEVVPCPVVRDTSGLAYSSRNQYLTPTQKQQAAVTYHSLQGARRVFRSGIRTRSTLIETVQGLLATTPEVKPEYIELVHPKTLVPVDKVEDAALLAIAAWVGPTRLIDNILLYNRKPVLAIDGPAGAGKSTVTQQAAQVLGLLYLDTGAMYRAVTWLVLQSGLSVEDHVAIADLVNQCQIELLAPEDPVRAKTLETPLAPLRVFVNGCEVTQAIRSLEVTAQVSAIAAQPAVRRGLVKQQQRYGQMGGIAIEGRDIGTHVFPDAELKIFLTASVQERARRRQQELKQVVDISLEQLQQEIDERDQKDSTRAIAPLRKAADAIEIQTDNLSIAEVTDQIVGLYREQFC